ncbi:MAG: hypothetical protein AABZ79_09300, partial [Pseudomonadota bacterium]
RASRGREDHGFDGEPSADSRTGSGSGSGSGTGTGTGTGTRAGADVVASDQGIVRRVDGAAPVALAPCP